MEKLFREIKLSRGLLFKDGNVLLAQDIRLGQGHFFLPGGNVEPGEPIKQTLAREWDEEIGWTVTAGAFVGCLEHKWAYQRKSDSATVEVLEINYLFLVEGSEETLKQAPTSKEPHLEFSWVPLTQLNMIPLLPEPLKSLIPDVATRRPTGVWTSTL